MAFLRLGEFVRGAWRKLPVETLVVAAGATGAIGLVHDDEQIWFLRLVLASLLLIPLAVAAHQLGRRWQALTIAAAGAIVLGALTMALSAVRSVDDWFAWPYGLSVLAAMLVPFVAAARRFTGFVRRFFEQSTTWGLLCVAATIALAVVMLALEELFDLPLERSGAAPTAVIVLVSAFVLLYLHRLVEDDAANAGRMPELWRRLATTIGAPFVCVMLAILVVYEASALIRGELPRNILSPLIMAAGFVGFLSTLIIQSVMGEGAGSSVLAPADPHRWARRGSIRLARAFPLVLLVLLPMAVWALWMRVDQYGLTPFRVVRAMGLLCLIGLSLVGAIRWLRNRPALSWEVPAAIIVAALAAAFGPTSAVQLSIRSQAEMLGRRLDALGAGRVVAPPGSARRIEVDFEAHYELRRAVDDLGALGGEVALRRVLSGEVSVCAVPWQSQECVERLGIHAGGRVAVSAAAMGFTAIAHGQVLVPGGSLGFVELSRTTVDKASSVLDPAAACRSGSDSSLALTPDAIVAYTGGAAVARGSLAALMPAVTAEGRLPPVQVPLICSDGTVLGTLAVQRLGVWRDPVMPGEVTQLTGAVIWSR